MAEDDDEYAYHCSECDLQVSESFNFCSRCGANIGAVEEEEEPSNVEDPTTAEQVVDRSFMRDTYREEREEPSNVEDPTLSDRDANALILQGFPHLWVSTAIGGSTPLQMIRAMQADGISELDALVQMCEAGFDAFCRNLADTANVKGATGYYKGRERDLYKSELLKVLTEHYGRPRAEQVIDRLSNL
jgi:hypothetical protein